MFGSSQRGRSSHGIGIAFWSAVVALACQATVAAITAARAARHAVLLGLFAAFLTGIVAATTIVTLPSLGSCVEPLSLRSSACGWKADGAFVRLTYEQVLVEGLLAALLGAGVGVGLKALALRRTARVLPRPRPTATTRS